MKKLFRAEVPNDILEKLLRSVGFNGLSDKRELLTRTFNQTLAEEAFVEVWAYYTPCFARVFLRDKPTFIQTITVCRQILRQRGVALSSREISRAGKKIYVWRLNNTVDENEFHLTFD